MSPPCMLDERIRISPMLDKLESEKTYLHNYRGSRNETWTTEPLCPDAECVDVMQAVALSLPRKPPTRAETRRHAKDQPQREAAEACSCVGTVKTQISVVPNML